ncbi:MAG: EAL domain-containing protein [Ferrovum sp.]|nr:EAL domain-containing protein [Ferrovum sp.]NDU87380.1 EAL domain-containing protein [Ferrovum sp.]
MSLGVKPSAQTASLNSTDQNMEGKACRDDRALLLREQRMTEIVMQIASDGLHVVDAQGMLVTMSDSFCSSLGYTREELSGRHIGDWDAKWSGAQLEERIGQWLQAGDTTFETQYRHKNGQVFDVEVHVRGFSIASESLLFCSARDISVRKQSESLIRLQAGALNNSVNGIAISDATVTDFPLVYVNPAFERITGYSSVDAIGRNCRFLQRDDRDQPELVAIRVALKSGLPVKATLRNYRKDGQMFWNRFQIAPVNDKDGHLTHFVAIINDVTERKLSDDYIRLVSQVFLHADESIYITDPQGQIIETNPAFTRTTGYGREEVLGRNPGFLQSGRHDPVFFANLWATVLNQGHWSGEIWNRRKNGEIYPDKLTISVVRNDDGTTLNFVCISSDITVLKAQQNELEMIALHDILTGLPNRALLNDRLAMALADARRFNKKMALCFIDLDGFKPVNDQFGHDKGDQVLVGVAQRMSATLRATDTVARLGGDEFVIVLSEVANDQELTATLQRIMKAIALPHTFGDQVATVSASMGVTVFPDDEVDAETLLRHADQAMYRAKEKGRNCFHFFDVVDERNAHLRTEGRTRVELALDHQEFELFYQPKVNLRTGQILGVEALIRWNHPERGVLLPRDFLPMVENSEIETRISEWVIATAFAQRAEWAQQGLELGISVNLPARHLHAPGFDDFIHQMILLYPTRCAPNLELEVLESVALWDIPQVTRAMEACRRYGVTFAIDDFGTGYASLDYLRRLPVSVIKIDQSFVRDMLTNREDLSIVEVVINLADIFNKEAIAEGVETEEQGKVLVHLGCVQAQGFFIANPMHADQVSDWISHYTPPESWVYASQLRLTSKDIDVRAIE